MEIEDILNDPLYQKFPRLYAVATMYEIALKEIEGYVDKIKNNSWCREFNLSDDDIEISLRAIIIRTKDYFPNANFEEALSILETMSYFPANYEKIEAVVGKRNFPILVALIR